MIFADSHTHTCFSFDGDPDTTPVLSCERAAQIGLTDLAITDHLDINGSVEGYEPYADGPAAAAVLEAKEQYRGRLHVALGLELGQATQYPEKSRAALAKHPYEFVLGSLHNLRMAPDFCYFRFEHPDFGPALIQHYFSRVLDETLELIDFPGIHSLAHLTYMHRYVRRAGKDIDFSPFRDRLELLFTRMAERGIALELNMSNYRRGIPLPMPTQELFRLYRACKGELVTVGSDAHTAGDLAANVLDGYRFLSEIGYSCVTVFRDGKPFTDKMKFI